MKKDRLKFFLGSIALTIPLTLIISFILLFEIEEPRSYITSLVIGAISSIILNCLHILFSFKTIEDNYKKIKLFTILSYSIRYLIYGGLILLAAFIKFLDPIFVTVGIVIYPTCLLLFYFYKLLFKKSF